MFSSTFFTTHLIKNSIQMIMCVREVPLLRTYMNSPLLLFHIYTSTFPYLSTFFFYGCQKRFFMSFFTCLFLAFLFLLTFVVLFLCCFICSSIVNIKEKKFILYKEPFWPENLLSEWVINLYDLQRMNK